jgi:alpha-mannosidase
LRATTFPDKTADRGIHRFAYAFCPFQRDDLAKVISEGYRLNNPLLVAEDVAFTSFAVVEDPGVIIETIKPAESGNGVVIRMYESLGRSTSTALLVDFEYSSAHLTDLLENPLGAADLDQLEFTPFEIKTILLERPS